MGTNIFTAIGAYSAITGSPFFNVPAWIWLTLLILGLIIAPFLAYHKIRTKLNDYEEAKPSIIVTHKVLNQRAILEVHNDGCTADFEAKARVIKGIPNMEPELYTMCWEAKGDHAIIPEGGTGTILVALYSIVIQPNTYGIDMYRIGTSGTQRFGVVPDGDIIIEVSINPTPPLKEPFEKRTYKLYLLEPAKLQIEPANS